MKTRLWFDVVISIPWYFLVNEDENFQLKGFLRLLRMLRMYRLKEAREVLA